MSSSIYAQNFEIDQISIEHGLPSSEVHDIYEDINGYLWFATDRGIARFDGANIEVYEKDAGLPHIVNFNFFEESPHKVWLANVLNELYWFDPTSFPLRFEPYIYNDSLKSAFADLKWNEHIRIIGKDSLNNLHCSFLVGPGGITIGNDGSKKINYLHYEQYEELYKQSARYSNFVLHITSVGSKKQVLVETLYSDSVNWDVYINDHNTNEFYKLDCKYTYQGKATFGIGDILQDEDELVFGFGSLLVIKNNNGTVCHPLAHNILRIRKHNGNLFIGTTGGLYMFRQQDQQLKLIYPGVHITDIFWDRTDGLWISSVEQGIAYVKNANVGYFRPPNNETIVINKIEVNEDYIILNDWEYTAWVLDHSLNVLDKYNEITFFSGVYSINDLDSDIQKYLDHPGLPFPKEEVYYSRDFFGLNWEDSQKIFCSKSVICQYFEDTVSIEYLSIPKMTGCTRLDNGDFLIVTEEGLYEYPSNEKPKLFSSDPIFQGKMIQIEKFRSGVLIASYNDGLIYVDPETRDYLTIDKSDGINASSISCFEIIDENIVWVGTYHGMNKLVFGETMNDFEIFNFDKARGLVSNEVMFLDEYNDTLWVATKGGLNFFPVDIEIGYELIRNDLFKIDSVIIDGAHSEMNDDIKINESNVLELYFKQIFYAPETDVSYEYKINGIDEDWISLNTGYIRLNNLGAGDYQLLIRSKIKNEKGDVHYFELKILTPWYKTWWAVIIYILLGLGIMAIIFKFLLNRIDKRRQGELEKVQLELKALISQMNPHFTFNTINSIQHYIIENESKMALDYLAEFALLMRQSLDFSRREFITLAEEISFLKLYVDLESKRFGKPITFDVSLNTAHSPEIIAFPALLLQPIIENAIVHGLQGIDYPARITLTLNEKDDYFEIEIADNGVGLNAPQGKTGNHNRKSHGLDILKSRIKLYNTVQGQTSDLQILANEKAGGGTVVRIKLFKANTINI